MQQVGAREKRRRTPPRRSRPLRLGAPLLAAAIALTLALPAAASASQTLTVEKNGTATGTVTSSPAGIDCGATCSAAFADATLVTLTGVAGPNAGTVQWSGCEVITIEKQCKVTMSAAKAVTATFDLAQRELKVTKAGTGTATITSSPAGINCGPTCSASFAHGTLVTLSAALGPNTVAVAWTDCAKVIAEVNCEVTMSAAKAVSASFKLKQVALTVSRNGTGTGTVISSPAGIECGADCSGNFDQGSTVTLTGSPAAGTEAVIWASGCASISAENKCQVTMSAAKAVSATFNHPQFPLTVTKVGPGNGTVTSTLAGIECGSTCTAGFDKGSTVLLTSVSGINTEAVLWSGCSSIGAKGGCEVTMSAAKTITATYKPQPAVPVYTVTTTIGGTGTGTVTSSPTGINCGPSCSTEVVAKATLTLIATPAPGSIFDHWGGGSCSGSGPCERNINSTRTVKAVFNAVGVRALAITITGSGAGTVKSKAAGISCSASCAPQISAGTLVNLSAKAAAGSTFSGFSGACSGIGTCKVQLSQAQSLTATFAKTKTTPQSAASASVANKAKVKAGKAYVKIRCNGPVSCRGSLKLSAKLKGKNTPIGSASFNLAPGAATTLKVALSAKAKQALRSSGKLKARVSGGGIGPHVVSLRG
jgi:septum formation inhibitor-activating ATPase MinD